VGAAATLVFVALLLLAGTRGPAQADTTVPAATPAVEPSQPALPADPEPGFHRDHDGGGFDGDHDGGGFGGGDGGGGGGFDGGGGGAAPAPSAPTAPTTPSTGGTQT
jgi:uncharacterized membrane protein YgcG